MSEPQGPASSSRLRYAVDETPSNGLTLGLSLQVATVILTGIILIPIIVLNAADYPEGLEWAVFAALVVSGLATILQVVLAAGLDDVNLEDRLGRLDEDHEIVRDVGPRILRHVAKEVKHEQFYDLDVLTVTVDTRPLV